MTVFAHIRNGIVVELFTPPADVALADCFHADLVAAFVEIPAGVAVAEGWTYDGKAFAAPVVPAPVPVVRTATTYALMSAFTDDQRAAYATAVKPWDQRLFGTRVTPWPEGNIKLGRIADALKTTPAAWFDAALAPAAG